jgi:hypothetical protein
MKRFAYIPLIAAGLMITSLSAEEISAREPAGPHCSGAKSGELTAGNRQPRAQRSAHQPRIRHDRAKNGGALTPKERRQVSRQQNRLSRQIYRDKHNGRKQ